MPIIKTLAGLLYRNLHYSAKTILCSVIGLLALCVLSFSPRAAAEGTAQFYAAGLGGRAPFAYFPGLGKSTFFVSIAENETIYLGSSALANNGVGGASSLANITLVGPVLNTVQGVTQLESGPWARNCKLDQPGKGFISTQTQEQTGPSVLAAGGYTACSYVVPLGKGGVYEVAIWGTDGPTASNVYLPAGALAFGPTICTTGQCNNLGARAWDITVASAASVAQTGRVWTNGIYVYTAGNGSTLQVFGKLQVQTKDGFTYAVDTNGLDPNAASFYSNNKGMEQAGAPVYASVQQAQIPATYTSQGPTTVDTSTSWINRIFFNPPSSQALLALSAVGYATSPQSINITSLRFEGLEGGLNVAGTAPLGGYVKFTSNLAASTRVVLDLNNDGIYGNSNDRVLASSIVAGANILYWDGKDGAGVAVAPGAANINLQINFNSGEVHFPVVDAESNVNGFVIKNAGLEVPQYWNDKPVATVANGGACASACGNQGGPPTTLSNLSGSTVVRHIWGDSTGTAFGDTKALDTWTYFTTPPQYLSVQLRRAELKVAKTVLSPAGNPQTGQTVTYSVVATNAGPSAVTGAVLIDAFPTGATDITVVSATASAGGSCGTSAVAATVLTVTGINLANAENCTYVLAASYLTIGYKTNQVAIQRPSDLTDPTATNPDAAAPLNTYAGVQAECNTSVVGSGNGLNANTATPTAPTCNNIAWVTKQVVAATTPNLSLAKANPSSFTAGSPASYQLTVSNAVGAVTSGATVVVNEKLPPYFAYNSASPGTGATSAACTVSGTQAAGLDLVCTLTTSTGIAAGGNAVFSLSITPQAAAVGISGTNKATVSPTGGVPGDPSLCTATGTPAGCGVAAAITPAAAAVVNLSLAKSNPTSLNVGVAANYALMVSNAAGAATSAASIVINDKLPPNFVFNSAAPGVGAVAANCTSSGTQAAGLDLVCTVTTATGIAASGNAAFTVNATPQAGADGVLGSNKATVSPAGGIPADPALCTSTGSPAGCAVAPSIAPPYVATVSLSLAKNNPSSFTVGTAANYTLTVSNAAGAATSGASVIVNDKLPPNMAFNGAAPGVGATSASCTASGTQTAGLDLICTVATSAGISGGGNASFTISVTPQPAAMGVAGSNRATVNPSGGAPTDPSLCSATGTPAGCAVAASIAPMSAATVNLSLAKANPTNFVVGVAADYVLTLSNAVGAATSAATVVVNDKLPPNIAFNSVAPGTGATSASCVSSGSLAAGLDLACSITTVSGIAASDTAAFAINVTPQTTAGGVVGSNVASVNPTGGVPADPSLCTATGSPAGCAVAAPIAAAPVNLSLAKANPVEFTVGVAANYVLTISNAVGAATSGASVVVNDKLPPNFAFNSAALGTGTASVSCVSSGLLAAGLDLVCTVITPSGISAGGAAAFTVDVTPQALAGDVASANKAAVSPIGATPVDPATCAATGVPLGCVIAAVITPTTSDMSVSFDISANAPVGSTVNGTISFANLGANAAVNPTVTLQLSPGLLAVVVNAGAALGTGVYNAATGLVTFPNAPASLAAGSTLSAAISFVQPNSPVGITASSSASNDTNSANNTRSSVVNSLFSDIAVSIAPLPPAPAGTTTTTVITVSNIGGATASFTSTVSVNGVVQSQVFTLAPNTSASYVVTVPITTSGATVTAVVSNASVPESNLSNNTASVKVISLFADVMTSIALPAKAQVGTAASGTVTFTNSATAGATATNSVGTVTLSNGQVISFVVGNLAPGASVSRVFTLTVPNIGVTAELLGTSTVATSTPETDTANNSATTHMTMLARDSSVSGRVFFDVNRNRVYDAGDQLMPGYRVELILVNGTATIVVGTATTNASGNYVIDKQFPGTGYRVQFRDPTGNLLVGTPFNQAGLTAGGNPSTGNNSLTTAVSPATTVTVAGYIDNVTLYAGDNAVQQNLPLDPSGVVYDSVTRLPVTGATVRLVGPAGFDPATHLLGGTNAITTDAAGLYQFLFVNSPPSGVYSLDIKPPGGYLPPNAVLGGVALPQATLAVPRGLTNVQPQTTAPALGTNGSNTIGLQGTQYFLSLNFNFATPGEVFNNHIPLDPAGAQSLFIEKLADKGQAEVGDSVLYRVKVRNPNAFAVPLVKIVDKLPLGFKLIAGTTTLQQGTATAVVIKDSAIVGFPGSALTFLVGSMAANSELIVAYRVRLGVGSDKGTGINTAQASDGAGTIKSLVARATVRVTGGVFTAEACVIGKVYVACDTGLKTSYQLGIPGVRMYLEDGTNITTDENGQYSICGLRPITHVLKLDPITLPRGARFGITSSRNVGDGDSLFLDLKNAELHRADFREESCTPDIVQQVRMRRATGALHEPSTQDVAKESKGIQFDSEQHKPNAIPSIGGTSRDGAREQGRN